MSYLKFPRIQFAGLFYTNPANLNNLVANYNLETPLDYNTGLYLYPDGVAQLWLQDCLVTSVVDVDGALVSEPGADALVGSAVTSPSPTTQKPAEDGGHYTFAKLVDLDPDMQFRSTVYGLRVYVDIPGGGGFSGLMPPMQLRDIFFARGNGGYKGAQVAVATWHQRLGDIRWQEADRPSAVFDALREGGTKGLDVKMSVDVYQTRRVNEFTKGDIFGYGRVVGAIGLAGAEEPQQTVPGRRLYTTGTFSAAASVSAMAREPGSSTREAGETAYEAQLDADAAEPEWNRTDFIIQETPQGTYLNIDLFSSMALAGNTSNGDDEQSDDPNTKTGKLYPGGQVVVGLLEGGSFEPLSNGAISLDHYSPLSAAALELKNIVVPDHAAIFQVELEGEEPSRVARTPVAIQVNGVTLIHENPNGYYINVETAVARLQPDDDVVIDLCAYEFGQPMPLAPLGLVLQPEKISYGDNGEDPNSNESVSTDIFGAWLAATATIPGHFALRLTTKEAIPLQEVRKPLDSELCGLKAEGSDYLVGEAYSGAGPPNPPLLSLLFWMNHLVVENPTWNANIKPIMESYARLYPGMVGLLDIGNLETIRSMAKAIAARYLIPPEDPGFMPVVRDMSPATIEMMLTFLAGLSEKKD